MSVEHWQSADICFLFEGYCCFVSVSIKAGWHNIVIEMMRHAVSMPGILLLTRCYGWLPININGTHLGVFNIWRHRLVRCKNMKFVWSLPTALPLPIVSHYLNIKLWTTNCSMITSLLLKFSGHFQSSLWGHEIPSYVRERDFVTWHWSWRIHTLYTLSTTTTYWHKHSIHCIHSDYYRIPLQVYDVHTVFVVYITYVLYHHRLTYTDCPGHFWPSVIAITVFKSTMSFLSLG